MNSRLWLRLNPPSRRVQPVAIKATSSPVVLLGGGLDAIICRTRIPAKDWWVRLIFARGTDRGQLFPLASERVERYLVALSRISSRPSADLASRRALGFHTLNHLRAHWERSTGAKPGTDSKVVPFNRQRAMRAR